MQVDFLAVSFVRDHHIIDNVRSYVNSQLQRMHPEHSMDICAKIEAYDSIAAMPAIIKTADCLMVARSDLGAQIPMEDVPAVQREIIFRCRQVCCVRADCIRVTNMHLIKLLPCLYCCAVPESARGRACSWASPSLSRHSCSTR